MAMARQAETWTFKHAFVRMWQALAYSCTSRLASPLQVRVCLATTHRRRASVDVDVHSQSLPRVEWKHWMSLAKNLRAAGRHVTGHLIFRRRCVFGTIADDALAKTC